MCCGSMWLNGLESLENLKTCASNKIKEQKIKNNATRRQVRENNAIGKNSTTEKRIKNICKNEASPLK